MENVTVISNPLTQNVLTYLRSKETSLGEFRRYSDQLSSLLLDHVFDEVTVAKKEIVVISILRAGVAMLGPALKIFPEAKVGFVGLERNEKTAIAQEYYWKVPQTTDDSIILITDPMLATGGSVLWVLKKLDTLLHKEIRIVSAISAPEGIGAVHKVFPGIKIITAAVDKGLNAQKYIVPGLGDYGDRYFGTS